MAVMAVLKMLAAVRSIDRKMIMHFKNELYHAVVFPNDLASKPGVTPFNIDAQRGARRYNYILIKLRRVT
jgi:hypothetical protein